MITQECFRRTEAMLLAVSKHISSEVVVAMIALTVEHMDAGGDEREVLEMEVSFPLSSLADRLGCDRKAAAIIAGQASQRMRAFFDLNLMRVEVDGSRIGCDVLALDVYARALIIVAPGFVALVRGKRLVDPRLGDRTTVVPDEASRAAIDLVGRVAKTGAATGLLLRLAGDAGSRHVEILSAVEMMSDGLSSASALYADSLDNESDALSAGAFLLMACLHALDPIVVIGRDILAPAPIHDDDEFESLPKVLPSHRPISAEGEILLALLPHAVATVIVVVPQDAVLHPDNARRFATALGPLRADRAALVETIRLQTGGDLSDVVAERLVGLWNGKTSYARSILATSARLAADTDPTKDKSAMAPGRDPEVFNAVATALALGIAPHVPATSAYRPKKRVPFHRELFVSDPPADRLFEDLASGQPKVILHGVPGTGKSAASAYIASTVLKRDSMEIRASDVLFHRLGHMERAIAAAFREARRANAVLIFDEAESLAQNRATSSAGNLHLATSMTNQLLQEIDDHDLPIILCTNYLSRIDSAIVRRCDVVAEIKPIPEDLEAKAVELILGARLPVARSRFGDGTTVASDYAAARKAQQHRYLDLDAVLEMVLRARDNRLGETGGVKRFGFLQRDTIRS